MPIRSTTNNTMLDTSLVWSGDGTEAPNNKRRRYRLHTRNTQPLTKCRHDILYLHSCKPTYLGTFYIDLEGASPPFLRGYAHMHKGDRSAGKR